MDIEKYKARRKREYEKHKEKIKKRSSDWYYKFKSECTPEKMRERLDAGIAAKRKLRDRHRETKISLHNWLGGKCVMCCNGDNRVLDFDHIDPSTKILTITANLRLGFFGLLDEVKKCQLLCANCHRIKTYYM